MLATSLARPREAAGVADGVIWPGIIGAGSETSPPRRRCCIVRRRRWLWRLLSAAAVAGAAAVAAALYLESHRCHVSFAGKVAKAMAFVHCPLSRDRRYLGTIDYKIRLDLYETNSE
jgi:hypothetical protein